MKHSKKNLHKSLLKQKMVLYYDIISLINVKVVLKKNYTPTVEKPK